MGFVGKLELLAKKHGKRIKDLIVVLWCKRAFMAKNTRIKTLECVFLWKRENSLKKCLYEPKNANKDELVENRSVWV